MNWSTLVPLHRPILYSRLVPLLASFIWYFRIICCHGAILPFIFFSLRLRLILFTKPYNISYILCDRMLFYCVLARYDQVTSSLEIKRWFKLRKGLLNWSSDNKKKTVTNKDIQSLLYSTWFYWHNEYIY